MWWAPRFSRAHPAVLDVVVAVATYLMVLLGSVADPHGPHGPHWSPRELNGVTAAVSGLACAALLLRRHHPRAVLLWTALLSALTLTADTDDPRAPVAASAAVALFTLASRTDRPTTWRLGALTAAALTATAMLSGTGPWYGQENFGVFAWMGMAAAAGDAVRSRRAFIDAIRERAERAERTREEEARRRVAEERLRIARELHDVVAHHIALVSVQAGVASHVMDSRPDQAKEALAHVREASRSALSELRTTVGLLRRSGDEAGAPTEPAPGLAALEQLVDGFVRAGLPVDLGHGPPDVPGPAGSGAGDRSQAADDRPELPASVDLAAYRIVQEALTNTRKHAGPAARAQVRVDHGRDALTVTVLDDGSAATPGPGAAERPGGHGLLGMRERVVALGGVLDAGPRPEGGFRVSARLPLDRGTAGRGGSAAAPREHREGEAQ
ncbi:sensor histidine kinase [Streptomyces sp. NPDC059740]|uniref:sensor histidine kinase n=1 Tax=Streptomyces sp. NPDC059740 TaxID=3346926 RepID=UPI003652C24F